MHIKPQHMHLTPRAHWSIPAKNGEEVFSGVPNRMT